MHESHHLALLEGQFKKLLAWRHQILVFIIYTFIILMDLIILSNYIHKGLTINTCSQDNVFVTSYYCVIMFIENIC